jgi:hypothetical protein
MGISPISNRCKVCLHEDVDNINARIIAGASSRTIAKEFNVGYKSVQNHANKHLPKQLVKAKSVQDEQSAERLLERIEDLYSKALLLIDKADSDQKWAAAATAIKEARACLELTGKLIGTLKTGHVTNVIYNTEFVAVRMAIYQALKPYPEARQAVIGALETEGIEDADYQEINSP